MVVSSSAEIGKTGAGGVSVRRCLPTEAIAEEDLLLRVKEVLLVVVIEAGRRVLRD